MLNGYDLLLSEKAAVLSYYTFNWHIYFLAFCPLSVGAWSVAFTLLITDDWLQNLSVDYAFFNAHKLRNENPTVQAVGLSKNNRSFKNPRANWTPKLNF
jgi:hypothetical protein